MPQAFRLSPRRVAAFALAALFIAHIAVFGWRSLAAERRIFSPDSFNYLTVARNLSNGKGFVQSAPGFNQPGFWDEQFSPDFPPQTRHAHSVAYPLAVFALAEAVRLPPATAALLLAAFAYALSVVLVFVLARQLWGNSAAMLAAAVFPLELRDLFFRAWTETLAVPVLLAVLALLAAKPSAPKTIAAGILSGAAVLARTGMIPLLVVGAIMCALRREKPAARAARLALFAAAAAVPLTGKLIGEGTRYSTYRQLGLLSPLDNLADFAAATADEFAVLAALAALALWRKWKTQGAVFPLNWRGGEAAPWLWTAAYAAFLLAAAPSVFFGNLSESRFRDPMEAVMVALWAGLAARVLAGSAKLPAVAAALLAISMTAGIAKDAKTLMEDRDPSDAARIENSPRLKWARENIRPDDLIFGADAMDLPYYFPEKISSAVSFSPFPFNVHVSAAQTDSIVRARCGTFGRALMILRKDNPDDYGDFIGGLMRKAPTPGHSLLADLEDGMVYEVRRCGG